jgi:hypothetical protein
MAQIEFVAIASIMFTCFLTGVYSNSTDDSNLLLFKYKCTQGDYYDLEYGGCVRCTICKRENFKTATPCSLHSDAVCGDCEDGARDAAAGQSITCIRIQSADKNDDIDIAHPGGDNDVALDSSPSRPSHSTTVNVTQTSPERKPINDASNIT